MGTSQGDFVKYPRTPHLFGSKGTDDDKHLSEAESVRFLADESLLRAGQTFAFSATNLIRQTRKRWIDLFADYNARIEAVYVEPRFETILTQNTRRDRPVPEGVIRELAGKVEPPNWTEAHDLVIA